jgi:hypothetical protein
MANTGAQKDYYADLYHGANRTSSTKSFSPSSFRRHWCQDSIGPGNLAWHFRLDVGANNLLNDTNTNNNTKNNKINNSNVTNNNFSSNISSSS